MSLEEKAKGFFSLFRELMADCEEILEWDQDLPLGIKVESYGELYELPVQQIGAFLFKQMGLLDAAKAAAAESDPNLAILDFAQSAEPVVELDQESARVTAVALVVLLINLESMKLFSMPVSELLDRVSAGDDEALFRAVVLDAAVLSAKPVANRIATAALNDDRSFFDLLAKAITRTKPTRPRPHLDEARLLMQLFDDAGVLSKMSDSDLTEWAVNKLDVYPASGDPKSAIRDQRRKRERAKGGPKS